MNHVKGAFCALSPMSNQAPVNTDSPADLAVLAVLLLCLLLLTDQAVLWDSASRELPSPLSAPAAVGRELWFPEQPNPSPVL